MKKIVWRIVVLTFVVVAGSAVAQEPANTYLIKGSPANLEQAVTQAGGTLLRVHPQIGYAVAFSTDPGFAARLSGRDGVQGVQRDLMVRWTPAVDGEIAGAVEAGYTGPDPTTTYFYPCQWYMGRIDAPDAWAAGAYGDDVTVAVLDSGVDPDHNELAGKVDLANSTSVLTPGSSLCNSMLGLPDEETIYDFQYHGTLVASQISGNGFGMASVAPGTEIVAVKVLNCLGDGSFADIIAGILYAADLPEVDIINMSLGAYFPKNAIGGGQLLGATNAAVNYATGRGKLVIASAGNESANLDKDKNYIHLPSQAGTAVGIYATNIHDDLASYTNFGRSGTWVGAPGGGIAPDDPLPGCVFDPAIHGTIVGACSTYSVFFGCGPATYLMGATGTSFAAPIAAGVAALIDGAAGGALNGGQLKVGLMQTADDLGKKGTDALFSHGRVNAGNAAGD